MRQADVVPVPLTETQHEDAAQAMARAFFDDPFLRYVLPIDADRQRLLPQFFLRLVTIGQLLGETYTTRETSGLAFWTRPGEALTDEQTERAGTKEVVTIIGEEPFARFSAVVDVLVELHKRDAPEDHWYLELLGVDVPLQGQGVGSALLQPVLRQAAVDGVPCYLETANEKNVPFYIKQGFGVLFDMVDPISGLRLWTFRREPRR